MAVFLRRSVGVVLLLLVSTQTSCKKPSSTPPSATLTAGPSDVAGLQALRDQIQNWSIRCGFSVAKDNCGVGDAALFNGLMCFSGDELACEAVRRSQGSDGRMWRSELRVAGDAVNSFSRDMALGVLAYLVTTRDTGLGQRWMTWIEQNDQRLCRESSDNRCVITPGLWSLFRDVWTYLGLPLTRSMDQVLLLDSSFLTLMQAQFAPLGFEVHLTAVSLLLRYKMGQKSETLTSLASALVTRQPTNPFFVYLSEGPSHRTVRLTHAWCPTSAPAYKYEWSFERNSGESPWLRSMGWECVMLINLLESDLVGKQ